MNIQGIKLRNFRSFKSADILFGRKNLIVGQNGTGKSSIIDAICYAADGTCRGTDEGGKGADILSAYFWLVNHGEAPAPSGVELGTDKGEFRRGVGMGPNSKIGESIRDGLGFRRDALRAVFRPGSFLSLPAGDQASLFTSLSAPEDIGAIATEHLGDLLEDANLPRTLRDLDALEAAERAKRPSLKKSIADSEKNTVSFAAFDTDLISMTDEELLEAISEAQALLVALKAERDALLVGEQVPAAPALPIDLSQLQAQKGAVEEYEAALKPFPGIGKNCPHCGKKVVLLVGTTSLLTVENSIATERALRIKLKEATERQKSMEKEAPSAPPKEEKKSPQRSAIEERIAKGDLVVSELNRLVYLRGEHVRKIAATQKLRNELAVTEEIIGRVTAKGPLRAALLEKKSGGLDLVAAVNEVSMSAGWGPVAFRTDPWSVSMNKVPAEVMSTSQRLALNIAIQTAIAAASGIKVLVVDEAQTFEEDSREGLSHALEAAMNHVDQLFLLASRSGAEVHELAAAPGWKLIKVKKVNGYSTVEYA